ncbi:hypothetical protein LTR95_002033 [Oleoguttula sp. CCFEE 5521]
MHTVRLDDSPAFETVSYVWGDASVRGALLLQDVTVNVPASSVAALRRIRLEDTVRVVWIDAVCIDQMSIDERTQQVGLMRFVYGAAFGNLIFLGESETAVSASHTVTLLYREVLDDTDNLKDLYDTLWHEGGGWKYSSSGFRSNIDVHALEMLLSVPWFTRLWVMQEVTAARLNTCLYGAVKIDLSMLLTVTLWVEHKFMHIPSSLYRSAGGTIGHEVWEFVDKAQGGRAQGASVGEALRFARSLEATQAADKVFGALGLMECISGATSAGIPALLRPDYRKDYPEVYRDAARYALNENDDSLDEILGLVSHRSQEELEDLSRLSWVPRWERPFDGSRDSTSILERREDFSACGHARFPGDPGTGADPSVLHLVGREVATVEEVSPVFDFEIPDGNNIQEWQAIVCEISKKCRYGEPADLDKILFSVLTARQRTEDDVAFRSGTAALRQRWRSLADQEDGVVASTFEEQEPISWALAIGADQVCDNRRVLRTSDGRLGIGPRVTKKGDMITVLLGCAAPYVMRKHDNNQYRLVGDCYLYGVMHGQLTGGTEQPEYEHRSFAVR